MDADKPKTELAILSPATTPIPTAIGDKASERSCAPYTPPRSAVYTTTIRSQNTQAAYDRNARRFLAWTADRGLALPAIE